MSCSWARLRAHGNRRGPVDPGEAYDVSYRTAFELIIERTYFAHILLRVALSHHLAIYGDCRAPNPDMREIPDADEHSPFFGTRCFW